MNKLKYYLKFIPVIIITVSILAISLVPFKVISYGFLPSDDALRHAAKTISGKDWSQILVLRPDIKLDPNIGWQKILEFVHNITGWDTLGLVLFSMTSLFILYSLVGLLSLRRPEAWPIMLLISLLTWGSNLERYFIGRPYIVTMSVLLLICFVWPRLTEKKPSYGLLLLLALSIAASTWIHCSWYMFCLPIIAFLLAREWLACLRLTAATVFGVALGATLTGHPIMFFAQTVNHFMLVFGKAQSQNMLVTELLPADGSIFVVMSVILLMMWRSLRGRWDIKIIDNPAFILASLSWVLGLVTMRVWLDVGIPAVSFWIANEIQDFLETQAKFLSVKRLAVAFIALAVFYFAITSDINYRWSRSIYTEYITADDPSKADLLPEPGGILYSSDMAVFFRTFFKNPHAPWRYMVGFETAIMPPEDLKIYRNLQFHLYDIAFLKPWIDKMKPEDRLIIQQASDSPPPIETLEWGKITKTQWSGRLPRNAGTSVIDHKEKRAK